MKSLNLLACMILCLLWAAPAHAQGVGASGNINGTVLDPTGAVVPNANVTAVETATGASYTVTTGNSGQYRFTGLPPANYAVTVRASGFQTQVHQGVVVSVGATTSVDFQLRLAAAGQAITITAEPPVVDTNRGSQANTVDQQYIADLPIDRRDYLSFTLLMPGVSNSTRIASDQDFRVKQTPQSGLSFYGSNGRGNTVTVDGGEADDDAGGVRLTISQDAVEEYQINRSNYAADLGSASGASVNIVSKSGSNQIHGGLFGFFRNDALDARDPFAFGSALAPDPTFANFNTTSLALPVKNSLSRQQYGGTVGFPIRKDKTFLFVAFEGLRQDSQNSVPLLTASSIFAGPSILGNTLPANILPTDPRVAQQAVIQALATSGAASVPCLNMPAPGQPNNLPSVLLSLPGPACAFALQSLLAINPTVTPATNPFLTPLQTGLNQFIVNQFEDNGGVFPYNTRTYLASARLDHRLDEQNQIFVRFNYGHDLEESPDVQSLTGFSAGSSTHNYDFNLLASWFHQFTPTTQNELRLQFDYNSFNVIPNSPAQPNLNILGFANNLGTNIFLPNFTITRRTEIADNVTTTHGHHTIKFGGYELLRGNHTDSHTYFPGRFVFGELPGSVLSDCLQVPTVCGLPASIGSAGIDALQAVSLGAPELYQQGFGDPATYRYAYTRPWTAFYGQDSWSITSNFTLNYGLRYELDSQFAPLTTYKKNFAPRVSFAWDPFGDHKTVVRGGYGIFYAPIYFQIPGVDYSLGVLNKNRSAVGNVGSGNQVTNVVGTCGISPVGPPLPPDFFPGNGSSPCNRPISIYVAALPPIAGVNEAGDPAVNSAVAFSTLFAEGAIQCKTPAAGQAACITPQAVAPLLGINLANLNSGPLGLLQVLFINQPNFRNPYSQQASLGIEREIATGFSISASYIYSHTIGLPVAIDTNVLANPIQFQTITLANGKKVTYRDFSPSAAFDPLSTLNPAFVPPCSANPFLCYANPFVAQNNQYSSAASALYQGGILEVNKRFSNYFSLMGNYTYSKAIDTSTDFNSDYGPQDPTNLALERAVSDFDQRNAVSAAGVFSSPWKGRVLSGFQLSPIYQYHSGHPFNLLAGIATNGDGHPTTGRPLGAPRNTGLGPDYSDFDMRLSWRYKLAEKSALEFTAEGFNLLNRTNYASVNNEVGPFFGLTPGFTTFNVHGSAALSPSTPLGFTSDFAKREIQLGVRLIF